MQERGDAGKEGIFVTRDSGKERLGTGMIQDWVDIGNEGYKKRRDHGSRDAALER